MPEDQFKIRITSEELANVQVPQDPIVANPPQGSVMPGYRDWGNIAQAPKGYPPASGTLFMTAWFYLGIAGLVGALCAWAVCEPHFSDITYRDWGNILLFPLMVAFMSAGFGTAESIVERSASKAIIRGILSLLLGLLLGFIFNIIADIFYRVGENVIASNGRITASNPAQWVVRALAWMLFGISGGLIYGIVGHSGKKILYGMLGGVIGAGIGGLLFDPIGLLTNGGGPSRAFGLSVFAIATGVSMGLVESALKDRWLHVSSGPLAGKQFILYRATTVIGSQQSCDIYLFKDPDILPTHATLMMRGPQVFMRAAGPVMINGMIASQSILKNGDTIQIGKYVFNFQEKGGVFKS